MQEIHCLFHSGEVPGPVTAEHLVALCTPGQQQPGRPREPCKQALDAALAAFSRVVSSIQWHTWSVI